MNTIKNTDFARAFKLEDRLNVALKWLENAKLDATQGVYQELISGIKPLMKTPIMDCFVNIMDTISLDKITIISISSSNNNIPEVMTTPNISIYGKQFKSTKPFNKGILNISGAIGSTRGSRYAELELKSSTVVVQDLVQLCLVMSYTDSGDRWLQANQQMFIMEVYSQMMRAVVNRIAPMDMEDGGLIKFIFAYYYATLMTKNGKEAEKLVTRSRRLFGELSGEGFVDSMEKVSTIVDGDSMTMAHVAKFIADNCSSKYSKMNSVMIYRGLAMLSVNSIPTWIAADYPPYMAYLILHTLSGNKHPILYNILVKGMNKNYVKSNVEGLLKTKLFYAGMD